MDTIKKIVQVIIDSLWMIPSLLVLSSVFVIDNNLSNGIITVKYFCFYASMGIITVATLIFILIRKSYFRVSIFDFLVLLFITSILFSSLVINDASQNTTKLTLLTLLTVLHFNFRLSINYGKTKAVKTLCFFIIITGLIEAIWGLCQLYSFIPSQHSFFKVTGSFFNPGPYAGYLTVVFPLALQYWVNKPQPNPILRGGSSVDLAELSLLNFQESKSSVIKILQNLYFRVPQIIAVITCFAILLVLPATMSRASWLAATAGSLVILVAHYYKNLVRLKKYKIKLAFAGIIAIVLLFLAFTGLYFLKKDSADGRTLMWKIAFQAAKEHPLGVGLGNFSGAYGEVQAAYFAAGKGTETNELVAGSPDYGFNEYLQIAVESGVISLVIFLTIFFLSLRSLIISRKWGITGSMVSLLVFAFLSYPFSVLPILIVFVFLLAAANNSTQMTQIKLIYTDNNNLKSAPIRKICVICVPLLCLSVTFFCLYKEYPKYEAYIKWNTDKFLYSAGLYKDVVKEYKELYPFLNDQLQFLFEYAQSLSKTEQYTESNDVLKRAMQISCDPMLYNIMGKNHQVLKEYQQAEECFIKASHIVPHRLYPYYLLTKLYHEMDLQDKVNEMADIVQTKEPKVNSTAVREMREEVEKLKIRN